MTRESQNFVKKRTRKIIAGSCFFAIIFFVTIFKGFLPTDSTSGIVIGENPAGAPAQIGTVSQDAFDGQRTLESEVGVSQMVIDVAGAVSSPGVLLLPEGCRVYEALEKAGGVTPDGDLRDINLAAELLDGEKLYIPFSYEYQDSEVYPGESEKSAVSFVGGAGAGMKKNGKININTASAEELQQLKGVGPSMAQKIVDYRKENGKFKNIEEIRNIKGIGEKTYEKLKGEISVT